MGGRTGRGGGGGEGGRSEITVDREGDRQGGVGG